MHATVHAAISAITAMRAVPLGYLQAHQLHRSISDLEAHPLQVHLHLPAQALLYYVFITKRKAASRNVTKQWSRMNLFVRSPHGHRHKQPRGLSPF
jgi:hypothetical protein